MITPEYEKCQQEAMEAMKQGKPYKYPARIIAFIEDTTETETIRLPETSDGTMHVED